MIDARFPKTNARIIQVFGSLGGFNFTKEIHLQIKIFLMFFVCE
jgi:hypothetical protein